MHIFNYLFLRECSVSQHMLGRLSKLEGFNARAKLMMDAGSIAVHGLERMARIHSSLSSNAIEGICISEDLAVPLIIGNTKPRGYSDAEIRGYSRCLAYIHENHANLDLSSELILERYEMIMEVDEPAFKTIDNAVVERTSEGEIVKVHPTVAHGMVENSLQDAIISYKEAPAIKT